MKNNEKGLKGLARSFGYAFSGVFICVMNERNMRIHLVLAAYVLFFSRFYDFTRAERLALFIIIGLVIATEMLNTAIEATIDLVTDDYAKLAKIAKDVSAGAVLIMAATAVIVGVTLFYDMAVLREIVSFFAKNLINLGLLFISVGLAVLFVFRDWGRNSENKR